ncbi:MAG: arylsulfatase [Pseudomonadales bacterium]
MKIYLALPFAVFLVSLWLTGCGQKFDAKSGEEIDSQISEPAHIKSTRPNILLVVVDDMGYSDIGAFGGEIATPALDALAQDGLQLTNFHVLPTCSPTRSVLLSGTDNHLAGLGTMGEITTPEMDGIPGYAGYLNFEVAALPELLQSEGYRTYMSGKWHLGLTEDTNPHARGFDESFAFLPGGGSHWSDKRPTSPLLEVIYSRNGKRVDALPDDFYSTKYYTDNLLQWLNRDQASESPFFAYLSFTAPHDPLHAPKKYIEKYKGKFDGGWDKLRAERFEALKDLGIVDKNVKPFPRLPNVKPWDQLSATEKAVAARNMEVYAAMIDYIDEQIKRVTNHLVQTGEYENTLILFFSDNGANGSDGSVLPGMSAEFMASFDNSLDNRGLRNSYIHMGAGWAQASMAPSRLMKAFPAEGGIKSPLLVKLPGKAKNTGTMNHAFFHVRDIMPTILDLADIDHPEQFKGRTVLEMQGQSVLDFLEGKVDVPYEGADNVGYEFLGSKAYIDGDWKILHLPKPLGSGDWQLYNLKEDPAELNDLSQQHPDKRLDLIEQWEEYKTSNKLLDITMNVPILKE